VNFLRWVGREIINDSTYLYNTFLRPSFKPLIKGLILIILGFYISRLFGFWRGPESYKIYFVGDLSSCVPTKQIYDGLEELKKYPSLKINGVPIKIIDINDRKNPVAAEIISRKLSKANDTLMVIGHIDSTQTEAALPNYLSANPPIPVILTRETNPYLVPTSISKHDDYPIFRLSPTDIEQAKSAANFAIGQCNKTNFWVVEDTINPVYSEILANEFIKVIREKGKSIAMHSDNRFIPPFMPLKCLEVDCIFFAGNYRSALTLINQINAYCDPNIPKHIKTKPMIICSDGCAKEFFVKQKGVNVNDIYLTHPLKAEQFNNGGYEIYGRDACKIIKTLVNRANQELSWKMHLYKRLGGLHRVRHARSVLIQVMKANREFVLETGHCKFGDNGERFSPFNVWQVSWQVKDKKFKFVDID